MNEPIRPENCDEIEACVAILWGEEGRDCHTKLALRNKCEQAIREMRAGASAAEVRGRG